MNRFILFGLLKNVIYLLLACDIVETVIQDVTFW